jgi:hypothetical protein
MLVHDLKRVALASADVEEEEEHSSSAILFGARFCTAAVFARVYQKLTMTGSALVQNLRRLFIFG